MHDWRSGLGFPLEQTESPAPPAPLDNEMLVVENLRLHAEAADLDRKLQRATATLQKLSARLVELERQVRRPPAPDPAAAATQVEVAAARDALRAAEARAIELDRAQAQADEARRHVEAELEALRQTRTLRYSAGARSLYGRLRRVAGGR